MDKSGNKCFHFHIESTVPELLQRLREGRDWEEDDGAETNEEDCLMGRDGRRGLAGEEGKKGLPRLWGVFGGSSAVMCV